MEEVTTYEEAVKLSEQNAELLKNIAKLREGSHYWSALMKRYSEDTLKVNSFLRDRTKVVIEKEGLEQ